MDCPHETHTADCIHLYDTGAKCYLEEGEEGEREGGREGGNRKEKYHVIIV